MNKVFFMKNKVSSQEPGERLAHVISEMFNPLFVAVPLFLFFALREAPTLPLALLRWVIAAVGISVIPYIFIRRGVQSGKYSDHMLSRREQRLVPLLVGILAMLSSSVVLYLLGSRLIFVALAAVIVILSIATVITMGLKWKISFHLVGTAGAVTSLILVFGPPFLLALPLVVLVAWARWRVRAHTITQAVAGTCLAVVITVIFFFLFRSVLS